MTRLPDWEDRLHTYLARWVDAEFEWGEADCALFAAGAVEAMTGVDPATEFRGQYDSRADAARALRAMGEGTLLRTIRAKFKEKPHAFARRGDLIWNGHAIGICDGDVALFIGEERFADRNIDRREGLVRIARTEWRRAFDV